MLVRRAVKNVGKAIAGAALSAGTVSEAALSTLGRVGSAEMNAFDMTIGAGAKKVAKGTGKAAKKVGNAAGNVMFQTVEEAEESIAKRNLQQAEKKLSKTERKLAQLNKKADHLSEIGDEEYEKVVRKKADRLENSMPSLQQQVDESSVAYETAKENNPIGSNPLPHERNGYKKVGPGAISPESMVPVRPTKTGAGIMIAGIGTASMIPVGLSGRNEGRMGKISYSGGMARMTGSFGTHAVPEMQHLAGDNYDAFQDMASEVLKSPGLGQVLDDYGANANMIASLYGMQGGY